MSRITTAQQELNELRAVFDHRWQADMRAIKRWQAGHPERELTWPSHEDLVIWLLEQLDLPGRPLREALGQAYIDGLIGQPDDPEHRWCDEDSGGQHRFDGGAWLDHLAAALEVRQ